jgi:hypothetical protein
VSSAESLLAPGNLHAWCAVPFDARRRTPEQRAEMLADLGFRRFAYDWRTEDIPTFDAEIDALKAREIELLAWWLPYHADAPETEHILATFARHDVHPQLWVMHSRKHWPKTSGFQEVMRFHAADVPMNDDEQARRVECDANRIQALVEVASPHGCKIGLYNHNGWFGIVNNQVAIVDELSARGVSREQVGLVYNFSHACDDIHDDRAHFADLWRRIEPYVDVVNVAGVHFEDGTALLPGDGDGELEMLRAIVASGWTGPVGVIAESGGDAAVTLAKAVAGLRLLASRLTTKPGHCVRCA